MRTRQPNETQEAYGRRLEDEARAEIARLRQRVASLEELAADPNRAPYVQRKRAIIAAAERHRFRNPELAVAALAGQQGDPAELVERLAKAEPYMTNPSIGRLLRIAAGQPDPGEPDADQQKRQEAARE